MKYLPILAFFLASPLYSQDAFEASLFDPNKMVYTRENNRTLDPLRSPLPMDDYLTELLDSKYREKKVQNRVKQLMYLDAEQPCNKFSNPRMEKRQWIDLVNNSLELISNNFSDALDANPKLKLAMLRDTEVMKTDPSCINGENECRLKLRANLEMYTGLLSPNFPKQDVYSPKKNANIASAEMQSKMRMVYGLYQDSMKEVMEGRAQGKNPSLQAIFQKKSLESWYQENTGSIPENMAADRQYKGAVLYAKAYQGTLVDVQNILVAKKNRFEEKIGMMIEPRTGGNKYDQYRPYCQSIDLPNVADFYSPNNYMMGEIKIPEGKKIELPCVEKISLREEHKIDINFNTGSDVIEDSDGFREKVLAIFEGVKARGYTVTGYQILASSSQVWGKNTPPEQARTNNIALSTKRANAGQAIVDKIPGFSELDHIPVDKLALDEGVADEKLKKLNINVLGPASVPAGMEGKLAEVKEKLYESLKPEFDAHGIFQNKEEYFKFLEAKKIKSVSDATFKPFQFFKIIVEGRKSEESPCNGKNMAPNDAKSKGSSGSKQ